MPVFKMRKIIVRAEEITNPPTKRKKNELLITSKSLSITSQPKEKRNYKVQGGEMKIVHNLYTILNIHNFFTTLNFATNQLPKCSAE